MSVKSLKDLPPQVGRIGSVEFDQGDVFFDWMKASKATSTFKGRYKSVTITLEMPMDEAFWGRLWPHIFDKTES